jgi:serralysin
VVAGYSYQSTTSSDFALVRYDSNGSLDGGFGTNGMVTTNMSMLGTNDRATDLVVVQDDGKVLVVGSSEGTCALARYNSDGSLDTGFGAGGRVVGSASSFVPSAIALQADGRIIVAGSYQGGAGAAFAVARYSSDGSLDTSFGADGLVTTGFSSGSSDHGNSVAIDGSGRIVVAGYSYLTRLEFLETGNLGMFEIA